MPNSTSQSIPNSIATLINSHHGPTTTAAAAWPHHLTTSLLPLLPLLTPTTFLLTLSLLKPPTLSLPLFHFTHSHCPQLLTPTTSSKTLHLLLRRPSPPNLLAARSFLLSLPSSLRPSSDAPFNSLLRSLSRSSDLRSALSLFPLIPSPSAFSYNSLLSALLSRGRTRSALNLFDEMLQRKKPPPDTCTFNTLLRGLTRNSLLDEAFRLFRDMGPVHRVKPDAITYNTLLDGLCRAGKIAAAANFFDAMKRNPEVSSPNVVSYTTLIRGFCGYLRVPEAVALFDEMGIVGLKPNKVTYNTIIKGLCEARRMDLVKEILEKGDGFRPDTCTFNTLIAAHCNAGGVREAMEVFGRMSELRVKTDSASYSSIIRGLCESGDSERGEELVDELLERGVLRRRGVSVPLMAAYNPILEYLCGNGKTDKAGRLLQELMERRATLDFAAFKTVILGYCREGEFREGYKVLASMVRRDVKPDIETFRVLITGFLTKGDVGFAWKGLDRMLGCGHRPGTNTFHSVLAGLLKKDSLAEEAGSLVEVMLERKILQNIDLSSDAIIGLLRVGLNDKAFKIVALLYDNGYFIKMENVVRILCQCKKFLEARELLLFSLERNEKVDAGVYDGVVVDLCLSGRAKEGFELFYQMIEKGKVCASSCMNDLEVALHKIGRLKEAEFVLKQIKRSGIEKIATHL